jgi:hypothetical protein
MQASVCDGGLDLLDFVGGAGGAAVAQLRDHNAVLRVTDGIIRLEGTAIQGSAYELGIETPQLFWRMSERL